MTSPSGGNGPATFLPQPLDTPLAVRHTNVSNPAVIHPKPSQQSITASEDYYSLSGSSGRSVDTVLVDDRAVSSNTIHRYSTPPSRYRTPLQSRDNLARQSKDNLASAPGYDGEGEQEMRKTPMRGQGKRRSTSGSISDQAADGGPSIPPAIAVLREGGIRRKPVPSTVMESPESPRSQEYIDQSRARSSVAQDIGRETSPPTPGQDDTPFIRFALDQLTRDEEVRGSRRYPDGSGQVYQTHPQPLKAHDVKQEQGSDARTFDHAATATAAAGVLGPASTDERRVDSRLTQQWPQPSHLFEQPPPRNPQRLADGSSAPPSRGQQDQGPDPFIEVPNAGPFHSSIAFIPGILRPVQIGIYIFLLLALLVCLLVSAIWSLTHDGLWRYGTFGDARYFVFEYLPTLLGVILFFWLVQIECAVYRIAPFIAMSSDRPQVREEGARLPTSPKTFLLPYLDHFNARQIAVGVFMIVGWLQIWTIPLLAASFNVHYYGTHWGWVATQGAIWAVIGLYIILLVSIVWLTLWLRKQQTGLRWDSRSLADMIVVLERSNALSMTEDEELRHEPAKLGFWQTARGGGDVFHTYGVADKSARQYVIENGRIREKAALPPVEPKSRFSDLDVELGREQRHSREKMLPKYIHMSDQHSTGGRALPWFLSPSAALLWAITAIVLLVAFLVVSYIKRTNIAKGFDPDVPAPVNKLGFSGTNFLYSVLPALLATICFLGWLDIDFAYRRLQPLAALITRDNHGEIAERSILLSYSADLPLLVTARAAAARHWRVALFSFISLVAAALPVLAGGIFWAQFYVPVQAVRISAHLPGYYALTALLVVYALGCVLVFPGRHFRELDRLLPAGVQARSFADVVAMVAQSKMLDHVAFRAPASKTALVTRLLASALEEKMPVERFTLGRYSGRDGGEYWGIDRVGA